MPSDLRVGERVVVPDPQSVNPLGASPPAPHGPGEVVAVESHPYGGAPLVTVRLDSGETRKVGSLFVAREAQAGRDR